MLTIDNLSRILGLSVKTIKPFYKWLEIYMKQYEIDTPVRQAAFLSQIAHESGRFYYVEEIASGQAYEGRKDLGNTQPGDGVRYKGRGLIQLTGRSNYRQLSQELGVDFEDNPELLKSPQYAVQSACWFWHSRGLNDYADVRDIRTITKRINGGYNGIADREALYKLFLLAYGLL